MKIKYWLDSGANINSCRTGEISLEDIGMTLDEWNEASDEVKDEIMKDYAWSEMDWGYKLEEIK